MIGLGIGYTGNFPPSMTTSCFGRNDFATVFSVVNMIRGVIRSAAFVVLGVVRGATGNTETAYVIFLILSIFLGIFLGNVGVIEPTCSIVFIIGYSRH